MERGDYCKMQQAWQALIAKCKVTVKPMAYGDGMRFFVLLRGKQPFVIGKNLGQALKELVLGYPARVGVDS